MSITCLATIPPDVDFYAFYQKTQREATLYVPSASLAAYKNHMYWNQFANICSIGDNDGDGVLNVKDVSDLIDLILAGTASIEDYPAADVNGDGNINVADMTSLIDMLLSSN